MSDGTGSSRAARAARNQALYREVNERVKELNHALDGLVPFGDWVCECANEECFEPVQLTREEYEGIRASGGARFFVKPADAHVVPEAEIVAERYERYWVVEKIGLAAKVAEREPARRRDAADPV